MDPPCLPHASVPSKANQKCWSAPSSCAGAPRHGPQTHHRASAIRSAVPPSTWRCTPPHPAPGYPPTSAAPPSLDPLPSPNHTSTPAPSAAPKAANVHSVWDSAVGQSEIVEEEKAQRKARAVSMIGKPRTGVTDKVRPLFSTLDADASGDLNVVEVKRALEIVRGRQLSDQEVAAAFQEMDIDGSGSVDLAEFVEWCRGAEGHSFIEIMQGPPPPSVACAVPMPQPPPSCAADSPRSALYDEEGGSATASAPETSSFDFISGSAPAPAPAPAPASGPPDPFADFLSNLTETEPPPPRNDFEAFFGTSGGGGGGVAPTVPAAIPPFTVPVSHPSTQPLGLDDIFGGGGGGVGGGGAGTEVFLDFQQATVGGNPLQVKLESLQLRHRTAVSRGDGAAAADLLMAIADCREALSLA
eukprot:Hpha_TRINITY_DN15585_c1_g11::TRINITY_DN15585_c1_g11_i1::g.103895::m.103895